MIKDLQSSALPLGYGAKGLLFKLKTGLEGFEPSRHETKTRCLTAWLQPNMGRLMGIEPTHAGTTIRCVNHFTTTAILKCRGSRNRTHIKGFGDLYITIIRYPYQMEGGRFELPNPKERIYSPPRLATSLPFHKKMENGGLEPPTPCL